MATLIIWSFRRMFSGRSQINRVFQAAVKSRAIDKFPPLQEWILSDFPKISLPEYVLNRTTIFFTQKTDIQLAIKQNDSSLLHFNLHFLHRLFRQPQGTVTLKTSMYEVILQFYYKYGEEAAQVFINRKKIGGIILDVKALPLPSADALLYDVNKQPIGKWACHLKPNEEVKLGEIRYGAVTLHGKELAKMLTYNPKRIGKNNWQLAFDLLNLQIYPDSPNFHYHRGVRYFQEINEPLEEEQEQWLLALTALLLYKDTWKPQGQRRRQ